MRLTQRALPIAVVCLVVGGVWTVAYEDSFLTDRTPTIYSRPLAVKFEQPSPLDSIPDAGDDADSLES